MNKDFKYVWVAEYLIGIAFLVAVLPFIIHPQQGWSPAHGWAYLLFIACAGIALISSASGTRQRLELADRISVLEKTIDELNSGKKQAQKDAGQKHSTSEHQLISSVN